MARKRYNNTTQDVPEENFKNPPNPKIVELSDKEKRDIEKQKADLGVVETSLEDMLKKAVREEFRKG